MKYLFVHEVSYLDKPVFEYQDFPERLSHEGHEVVVVDFVEHQTTPYLDRRISRTGLADVRLISIPHSNLAVLKYFQAQWNYVWLLRKLLREERWDCIFLYSVFINGVTTAWMAPGFNVPVVFRAIDVYHQLRPGWLTQAILKWGESYVYRRVQRILASNDKLQSYVSAFLPQPQAPSQKTVVLDHGVDVGHFSGGHRNADLAQSLGIQEDDFVIVFLGTTYTFSRLDQLLVLLAPVLREQPHWKVLIMGAGELDAQIGQTIKSERLENQVIAVGMIDYSDLPRYLVLGRVGINPFEINDITRDIIPIKNLQYLAAGLPVVSTPLPDLVQKIPPNDQGIFYSSSDHLSEVVSLLKVLSQRTDVEQMRAFVKHYAHVEHGMGKTIQQLVTLMNEARI